VRDERHTRIAAHGIGKGAGTLHRQPRASHDRHRDLERSEARPQVFEVHEPKRQATMAEPHEARTQECRDAGRRTDEQRRGREPRVERNPESARAQEQPQDGRGTPGLFQACARGRQGDRVQEYVRRTDVQEQCGHGVRLRTARAVAQSFNGVASGDCRQLGTECRAAHRMQAGRFVGRRRAKARRCLRALDVQGTRLRRGPCRHRQIRRQQQPRRDGGNAQAGARRQWCS